MERTESKWIDDWNPEDAAFWDKAGKRIARRNLIWSIVAENIGFSVWLIWSVDGDALAEGRVSLHDRPALQPGGAPGPRRLVDAISLLLRGPEVRRPKLDDGERAAAARADDLARRSS